MNMWDNIIFVCTGNTCRSPMCAAVAHDKYGVNADSRGLAADGSPVSENAVAALSEKGYSCAENRPSRQLTAEDAEKADLIVTVTPAHAQIIRNALPQYEKKIRTMPLPISDPYGGDLPVYRRCLSDIEAALDLLFGMETMNESQPEKMDTGVKIVDASPDLLDEIAAMELRAFAVPWSKKTFEGAFAAKNVTILAALDEDGTLMGYACLLVIAPDGELMNIAVDDCFRGRGIGSALMEAVLERAAQLGAEDVFLEVRESNAPARHLYEKYGFETLGRRKKYYQKPVEDAILMKRTTER